MFGRSFRLRQPLRDAGAVGPLTENPQIALAVGLECHPLAVAGPDRIAALPAERELPHRRATCQLVNPDGRAGGILDVECDKLPVW